MQNEGTEILPKMLLTRILCNVNKVLIFTVQINELLNEKQMLDDSLNVFSGLLNIVQ